MQVQLSQLLHILYLDNNGVSEQTALFLIFWVIVIHVVQHSEEILNTLRSSSNTQSHTVTHTHSHTHAVTHTQSHTNQLL